MVKELTRELAIEARKTMTGKEICEKFGISKSTYGRMLAKWGLTKTTARLDISDEDVLADWNAGLTIVEIARKHNASHDTITKRLAKYGIKQSRRDGVVRHFKREHQQIWDEVKADLDAGLPITTVREKHHLRMESLKRLMSENGYQLATSTSNLGNLRHKYADDKVAMRYVECLESFHNEGVVPTYFQIAERMGYHIDTVRRACKRYDLRSFVGSVQSGFLCSKLRTFFDELGVKYEVNNRSLLVEGDIRYEIDIYLPDYNIGVEVNPTSTHSVDMPVGLSRKEGNVKMYHQRKSLLAEKCGVALIHFYDYDFYDTNRWAVFKQQMRALVSEKRKIGARQCELRSLSAAEYTSFLNTYHFQGVGSIPKCRVGLIHDDVIVGVLGVGASRYTTDDVEILRYCMRPEYIVSGGFERLFKKVVAELTPKRVVSYMDLNKRLRVGSVYDRVGFVEEVVTTPDYVWSSKQGTSYLTRQQTSKKQLVEQGFDASKSETEIMLERGYKRVFGAGSKRYVWTAAV